MHSSAPSTEWSELFTNNPSYEPTSYKALDNLTSNDKLAFLHHEFWHEIREWTRNDITDMTRIVHPDLTGPGGIFIGGMNHALNETILEENNIQAVISIHPKDSLAWDQNDTTSGLQRFFTSSSVVKYPLIIPLEDNANSDLISCFDETNAFIKKHTIEGRNILIHCKSGRSRSVAALIAYLQQKFYSEKAIGSLEREEALEEMRVHREDVTEAIRNQRLPVIIIMERFAELLELYDLQLIGASAKGNGAPASEPVKSVTHESTAVTSDKNSDLPVSKVVQTKGGAAVLKICVAAVFFKNNQKPTEAVVHQFFEINEAYFYELETLEYKGRSVCTLFDELHQKGEITPEGVRISLDETLRNYGVFHEHDLVHAPKSLTAVEASTLTFAAGATVVVTTTSNDEVDALKSEAFHVINYRETPNWGEAARALTPKRPISLLT
ncbi:dual specificity phosphatase [Fusarium flagelliforme]|uniref:protein-tyrosine-phosphatase n=1 Tax=Fusarium flagelliforme TaxID=2675880 RepID=A0A395MIR7_9HYPO|nr:dual specificity phosphatase [Fusarium flagelliforme]